MSNKIYILDIETSNISGIDVAKTIRNSVYFDNGDTAGVVSDFAVVVNFSVPAP